MNRSGIGRIVEDHRLNAMAAWALVVSVVVVTVASLLDGELLWTGFAATVGAIAIVPPLVHRSLRMMLPWEVLVLAILPLVGRLVATTFFTRQIATYLSVAALALLVAVELHAFTPVQMNDQFAVFFVVMTTMATAGLWAIARWLSDIYLGTGFLTSEDALMWEFVASTAVGLLAGAVFVLYFRRLSPPEKRLPEEVQ
jgi:hypothetical protein